MCIILLSYVCYLKLHSSLEISPENLVFNNLTSVELRTGYTTYDLLGIAALLECSPNLETLIVNVLLKIDEDVSFLSTSANKAIQCKHKSTKCNNFF